MDYKESLKEVAIRTRTILSSQTNHSPKKKNNMKKLTKEEQKEKAKLKGKCTNCLKPMEDESNENWQIYCPRKKCVEAFIKSFSD